MGRAGGGHAGAAGRVYDCAPMSAPRRSQGREPFPPTMTSAVIGTASAEPDVRKRSWDRVARAYRRPVVGYIGMRFRRSESDAEDLANAFLTRCVERETFTKFDPDRGRFRTFLRTCVDRFVTDEIRAKQALRRGGRDAERGGGDQEIEAVADEGATDALAAFDAAFTRRVVELAVESLREELGASKKDEHLAVFERYYLSSDDPPGYAALAEELGLSIHDVTNRLHFARKKFKAAVLEVLRDLTATDDEWRDEVRAVLGVDP